MNPVLQVDKLSVSFKTMQGGVQALKDVSFRIEPGETVGLVGESGCGKSVTAQTIMGLLPSNAQIDSGSILFQNQDILDYSERKLQAMRGKEIGMIFQDPMTSLNPTMRIGTQIMEAVRKNRSLSHQLALQKTLELLELVGIADPQSRFHHYPHELSGGMRQRVVIAIALSGSPKLLIADEPTTALDVTIQAQILEELKKIQKKMGMSILLITHDLGVVASMCERVLIMYGGQIMESADVHTLYKNPQHPYTQGLLNCIPRLDLKKTEELKPIAGSPPLLLPQSKGCPFYPRCPHAMYVCKEHTPLLEPLHLTHSYACWLKAKNLSTLM